MTTPAAAPAAPAAAAAPAASASDSLIPAAPAAAAAAPAAAAPAASAAAKPGDSLLPAAAPAAPAATSDPNSPNAYLLAEGVQGTGERPAWFKADKYASVAAQAEAYTALEKRFGSFVGAPTDGKYTFTPPEGLAHTLDDGHPLVGEFQKWAGSNQLSQKGYNELMGMLLQYELAQQPNMADIKKDVGDKADERIAAVAQWGSANLDATGYETLREAVSGPNAAAVFKVLEAVIGKTKQVAMPKPGQDVTAAQPNGLAAIQADHAKRGSDGKLLYDTDPKYRAEIERRYAEYTSGQKAA